MTIIEIDRPELIRLHARFWSKVSYREGDVCWPWQGSASSSGHGSFHFDGRMVGTHRIAWMLFSGDDPGDGFVCHHCDNPPCCNPSHLYLGDASTNMQDRTNRNRMTPVPQDGEANHRSKLTANDVKEIRRLYRETALSQSEIASQFGVRQTTVFKIVHRHSWRHV